MPLVAFILLAVVCLALLGFACACLTDHAAQAVERAVLLGGDLPLLVEVWATFTAALAAATLVVVVRDRAVSRASPALLQRFLF